MDRSGPGRCCAGNDSHAYGIWLRLWWNCPGNGSTSRRRRLGGGTGAYLRCQRASRPRHNGHRAGNVELPTPHGRGKRRLVNLPRRCQLHTQTRHRPRLRRQPELTPHTQNPHAYALGFSYTCSSTGSHYYSVSSFKSANLAAMVALLRVSFLMVKSSALLFAKRRLFSEESRASLVFCR